MLNIGTVFSGIGAVEHALERMDINYNIAFACDNGDVDILSKKIEEDFYSIRKEINELKQVSEEDSDLELEKLEKVTNKVINKIVDRKYNFKVIKEVFDFYYNSGYMNKNQHKNYTNLFEKRELYSSHVDNILYEIKIITKLESDISKSGLEKKDKIKLLNMLELNNFDNKKILKEVKFISEKLSMLHEKINTEKIRKQVFSMKGLESQKSYVDKLYSKYNNQNKVKKSYLENYNITDDKFHWNVSFFDGRHFRNKIDLFVGGSPCQSFSLVGKQRGLDDTRGTLFYEYARLVDEIKPKVFIYENVKAILSNDGGETWKTITTIFENLGYDWKYQILNAKNFGIPQNRERVFVVGFRKDLKVREFSFPRGIELKKTMKDFLIDNVSGKYYLAKKGVDFVTSEKNISKKFTQIDGEIQLCQKKNQQFNWHGDFIFEEDNVNKEELIEDLEKYFLSEKVKKYVLSTGTKGFYSKPEIDLDIARPLLQSMHKMHRAGVDNYVTTNGRLRKLTPRECLRLMGFCDSFKIVVSDTSAYQQSGNSIVVDVLINILIEIFKVYPSILGGLSDE